MLSESRQLSFVQLGILGPFQLLFIDVSVRVSDAGVEEVVVEVEGLDHVEGLGHDSGEEGLLEFSEDGGVFSSEVA